MSDQDIINDPAAYVKKIRAIQIEDENRLGVKILKSCMVAAVDGRRTITSMQTLESVDLQMLAQRFHVSLSRDMTVSPHSYKFTLLAD